MLAKLRPSNHNLSVKIPLLLLALLLLAPALLAQAYQGTLRGALSDDGGKALSGATLTLTNEETNASRTTVTNDAGEYLFERVDPGRYKISATLAGFKQTNRAGIVVETQQQITLDLALAVGEVTETVTISSEVPLIETATASTGTVFGKQALDELPNAGRSPLFLTAIAPNVIPAGNPTYNRQQDQGGSSTVSLAGGPAARQQLHH